MFESAACAACNVRACHSVSFTHVPILLGNVPCKSMFKTYHTPCHCIHILTSRHPHGEASPRGSEHLRLRGRTRSKKMPKPHSEPAAWGWLVPASVYEVHAHRAREKCSSAACAAAPIIFTNMSAFCALDRKQAAEGQQAQTQCAHRRDSAALHDSTEPQLQHY